MNATQNALPSLSAAHQLAADMVAELARRAVVPTLDPSVGRLVRDGKTVFYRLDASRNYRETVATTRDAIHAELAVDAAPAFPGTSVLTSASLALFDELAGDAPNWNGSPLVYVTKAQRGNLTDLKVRGLITTTTDEGHVYANFTAAGERLAAERGFNLGKAF